MATSTTEAFTLSKHDAYPLATDIISKANEKIWAGEIVATASTHGFWEPDKEFKIKVKVNELKRKFHQNRFLQVKHLPRDVTEGEIRQMLSDFPISSVILSCGQGSAGSANAYLEDPEMLEDWDRERHFLLRGQRIPVSPSPTEMVLCIARFPLSYSELSFTGLVSSYGEVKMCFLMISEKSGKNKGYGFVEYSTKESAVYAKSKLDGLLINDRSLCAEFIDSSHLTFESLHSKCLYVDNLPRNFRDMGEFRSIFSLVVKPPYCQIALKNGCPQDWGLVEFNSGDDAENTLTQLNGYELRDRKLRISYYVPGVRAINLYLKLLNEPEYGRVKTAGLLPDPPAPAVYQTFKNLQKQNPVFAQNLQNIMFSELLGGGNGTTETPANGHSNNEDVKHTTSFQNKPPSTLTNKNNIVPPPLPPLPSHNEPPNVHQNEQQQSTVLNLIAGQLQAQLVADGINPAFLHSPQMVSILKNCVKGVMNGTPPVVGGLGPVLPPAMMAYPGALPGITAPLPVPGVQPYPPPLSFEALLNDPRAMPMISPTMLQKMVGLHAQDPLTGVPFGSPLLAEDLVSPLAGIPGTTPEHFWSALINNTAQQQLDLNAAKNIDQNLFKDPKNMMSGVALQRGHPSSLPEHYLNLHHAPTSEPVLNTRGLYNNGLAKSHPDLKTISDSAATHKQLSPVLSTGEQQSEAKGENHINSFFQRNGFSQGLGIKIDPPKDGSQLQHILNDAHASLNQFLGKVNGAVQPATINIQQNFLSQQQHQHNNHHTTNHNKNTANHIDCRELSPQTSNVELNKLPTQLATSLPTTMKTQTSNNCDNNGTRNSSPGVEPVDKNVNIRRPSSVPSVPSVGNVPPPLWAMNIPPPPITTRPPPIVISRDNSPPFVQPRLILSPRPVGFETKWNSNGIVTPPPLVPAYPPPQTGRIRGVWNPNPRTLFSCPPPNVNITPSSGQKRKHPKILPSPEPSPEGNYIGQHSQGLGGHYADSYFKRKRKN